MSFADKVFIDTCKDIPKTAHGIPTAMFARGGRTARPPIPSKKFGVVNRYDLEQGILSSRSARLFIKSAIDELLWIWQKKSNNIHDLSSHVWDSWADENGSIGKAYGYQLGVKHHYKEGDMDQVDRVLYDSCYNPCKLPHTHKYICSPGSERNGALPMRLQYDLQRDRQEAERHSQSAFSGYARRQHMERVPVFGARVYVRPGQRA